MRFLSVKIRKNYKRRYKEVVKYLLGIQNWRLQRNTMNNDGWIHFEPNGYRGTIHKVATKSEQNSVCLRRAEQIQSIVSDISWDGPSQVFWLHSATYDRKRRNGAISPSNTAFVPSKKNLAMGLFFRIFYLTKVTWSNSYITNYLCNIFHLIQLSLLHGISFCFAQNLYESSYSLMHLPLDIERTQTLNNFNSESSALP
jgi:hypothetical protein